MDATFFIQVLQRTWLYACKISALLRASSKYSSHVSATPCASAAATCSIVSLSSRLHTMCSPSNALLSSPKMVFSPLNCSARAGKNSGSSWILLIMWLTKLHCKCTQPSTSRFLGSWIVFCATGGSSSTSVDPSERASSEAVTVGDGGVTSCSK